MKTITLTYPHSLSKEELPETVAAIGFFDGIHKGHQEVIQEAINDAKQRDMQSAVITFHPHPSVVLKQASDVQYITPLHKKKKILQQLDVDLLYIITFNKQLSSLTPSDFIKYFIVGLRIKHLVAGFDYTFGHKGKGNMNNIAELAQGAFTHMAVNKIQSDNEKISSTKIRKLLQLGDISEVNRLLGRPFTTDGLVIEGERRGRELGFPTANLEIPQDSLLPKLGIYAVKVSHKNIMFNGIASLGTNPTFTPERRNAIVEIHILDFDQTIYHESVTVEWHHFIREEKPFDSTGTLIDAMNQDEKETRRYFSGQKKT